MGKRDLLLEIGTEEIPALSVDIGIAQLKEEAIAVFGRNRLAMDSVKTFGSPRRLALFVSGLAEDQTEQVVEVKGPPKVASFDTHGNPTKAAEGFAASQRVALEDLVVKEEGGREYVYAIRHETGCPAVELLPSLLEELVSALSFPKSMRWGAGEFRFVRPIRWLLALFGPSVVGFSVEGLRSSNSTRGHRFLSGSPLTVSSPGEYQGVLEEGRVVVDHDRRSVLVREAIVQAPAAIGGSTVINEKTFEEVVNLVEYPNVVLGSFDEEFAAMPRDVLATAMESHQRYFPVENAQGDLMHYFVVVHNGNPEEDELIRRGHERVIRARLADARFFFREDSKQPLEAFVENLRVVVFQEKLGTVYEKTLRLGRLAERLAAALRLGDVVAERAKRAAFLSKADLTTEMVVEFPSLQGSMGREYALLSGEGPEIATAVYEHYLPRFAADVFPSTVEGQVVAFADKLDTIAGCLSVGLVPTGSEDPYALRRAAFGLVGIVLSNGWRISFSEIVGSAVDLYAEQGVAFESEDPTRPILEFLTSRARAFLISDGTPYDAIDAALALGADDLVELRSRAIILHAERESTQMADVLFAFNRAKNLARPELGTDVDESAFEEAVEGELYESLLAVEDELAEELENGEFARAIEVLSKLRKPIDAFFDGVLVMAEDARVRENRLKLLNKARMDFLSVADFSKLAVPSS
ncbi:MAG: glycine--tRNA ligase subunit beta [Candidatus Aquicultorales bacterium]